MPVTYNLDVTKFHAANGRSRRSKRSATPGAEPTSRVARPCGWGEDAGAQQAQGPQRVNRFTHMTSLLTVYDAEGRRAGSWRPGRPCRWALGRSRSPRRGSTLGVAIGPAMAVTTYAVGVR